MRPLLRGLQSCRSLSRQLWPSAFWLRSVTCFGGLFAGALCQSQVGSLTGQGDESRLARSDLLVRQMALRSSCQWFKLQISADGQSLSLADSSRVYDGSSSNPCYYYMPSLMVDGNNEMVASFSGSRSTEYIGAFFFGRLADGSTSGSPALLQSGRAMRADFYWGDYSSTCLDPVDFSIWTVQEYAKSADGSQWGTWIDRINK